MVTWATTRMLRSPKLRDRPNWRGSSFSAPTRSVRVARNAGTSPKTTPVRVDKAAQTSITRSSGALDVRRAIFVGGGIGGPEALTDHLHFRRCRLFSHAVAEPPRGHQPLAAAVMDAVASHARSREAVEHRERRPEVRKEHRFGT